MTTDLIPVKVGNVLSHTLLNAIASNAFANSADAIHIDNQTTPAEFYAEFRLTGTGMFATAPTAGSIQLAIVKRDLSGNQGPSPSLSGLMPVDVYTFSPTPQSSNSATEWIMSCRVPVECDCDYWLFNNGTGYSLSTNTTIEWQLYTYGY